MTVENRGIGPLSGVSISEDVLLRADGTVTAHGRSALILAPEGCEWAPDDAFGPGASGNQPPDGWDDDFEVPVRYLVSGALSAEAFTPVGPLRPG